MGSTGFAPWEDTERGHSIPDPEPHRGTLAGMKKVLLVADRRSTSDRVHTALAGADVVVVDHADPKTASAAAYETGVVSVVVDMQVAAMGAMALTRALRAAAGTRDQIPVTILLDREADAFLAKRAGATNWLTKDYSPDELRAAVGVS